jgi:glycosidase
MMQFDAELFTRYQHLFQIRNQEAALRPGTFRLVTANDERQLYIFERSLGAEIITVALNNDWNSRTAVIEASQPYPDVLTGKINIPEQNRISLELDGKAGAILKRQM